MDIDSNMPRFVPMQHNAFQSNSIHLISMHFNSVQPNPIRFSIQFNSIQLVYNQHHFPAPPLLLYTFLRRSSFLALDSSLVLRGSLPTLLRPHTKFLPLCRGLHVRKHLLAAVILGTSLITAQQKNMKRRSTFHH